MRLSRCSEQVEAKFQHQSFRPSIMLLLVERCLNRRRPDPRDIHFMKAICDFRLVGNCIFISSKRLVVRVSEVACKSSFSVNFATWPELNLAFSLGSLTKPQNLLSASCSLCAESPALAAFQGAPVVHNQF